MPDFLTDFFLALTWQKVLVGALIFLVSFFVNLGIVSLILVKLPADHFSKHRKTKFWAGPRPALHAAKVIGKNIGGVLLVALGIVLSLPGVPGQGLLTVLLGIMLLDFPGRHRLEQKLLSKPSIVNTINKLRGRFGKKPLELN
nr:putative transmembrane protein (PGPGW) [uncultured bacterium]